MALVPTLLAIAIGLGLGLRWGGRIEYVLEWRPMLPAALGAGVALRLLVDLASPGGWFGSLLAIASTAALLAFAVINIRTGGMVLVAVGLGLNLLVMVLNGGTPVSASALVSAGVVSEDQLGTVALTGGKEVADGALLGFLGDVIPLPWGQIVSIGDLLTLGGLVLVAASVVRRYEVRGGRPSSSARPQGNRSTRGTNDYRTALDALGRGPAPRRGPGLHPSRLDERRKPTRVGARRPGTGPR